jgi:MFS family permease
MYMGIATSGYSTAYFIPTILAGFGYTSEQAQLHTIPVYVVCTFLCLTTGWASDRLKHRYSFIMVGVVVATIGYIILLCQTGLSTSVLYFATFLVLGGVYIVQPMTMVWLTNNMGGHYKRSFGAAIQIGLGNVGGIIGSNIYIATEAPRYHTGFATALGMLWVCALMATIFYFGMMWENKKRDRGERDERLQSPENLGDYHPEFRFIG